VNGQPHSTAASSPKEGDPGIFGKAGLHSTRQETVQMNVILCHLKVKVKFTLEQATKAQRGRRGIVVHFFNLVVRWGQVVNATIRPHYPLERHGTHCI